MTEADFQKVFTAMLPEAEVRTVKPYGSGHINDTFLVQTRREVYILQRINQNIFSTPALVHNFSILNKAVENYQRENNIRLTPRIYTSGSGEYHFIDQNGAAWRKVEFLSGSQSCDISGDTNISFAAAQAYGHFQLFLNTLDAESFRDTIPQFHHPGKRIQQFEEARGNAAAELLAKAAPELAEAEKFKVAGMEIVGLMNSGRFPMRLSHNDAKLNNVIFHAGQAYVIDLDTVMPGSVLFDFGDMVRSFTSPAAEDEPELEKTVFRMAHFEALAKGYLGMLKKELSEVEKQNLLPDAKAVIYEQALRFLSDFLNGNTYYKVAYPDHNLVRCRTQFKLLAEIEENESRAAKIIHNVLNL